jgi:hypothetical protein
MERVDGRLIVNPGAAGPRRFDLVPCVAILTIADGRAEAEPAERCVVRVEKVRSLGSADDSFDGQPIHVAELGAQGWVVGERLRGMPLAPLRRFDASGRRTGDLGRVGQGPGEMQMPWFISAARGGSLRVWDGRSRQLDFDSTGKSVLTKTARNGLMGGHSWAWVNDDEFVAVDMSPVKTGSAPIHRRAWSDRLSSRVELPQLLGARGAGGGQGRGALEFGGARPEPARDEQHLVHLVAGHRARGAVHGPRISRTRASSARRSATDRGAVRGVGTSSRTRPRRIRYVRASSGFSPFTSYVNESDSSAKRMRANCSRSDSRRLILSRITAARSKSSASLEASI